MNIARTIIGLMMSGALLSTAACGDLQGGQNSQAPQRSEEGPSATTSVPSTTRSSSLEAEAQTTESPPGAKTTRAETPKNAQAERTQEEVVVVKIRGLEYLRSPVTVAAGTTVRWVNEDRADHTVTSDDPGGPLRSEAFGQGDSFKHRFRDVGEFAYHCEIHPFMNAGVIVK